MTDADLDRLYKALEAFENDNSSLAQTQIELAKEGSDNFRSEWKRKTGKSLVEVFLKLHQVNSI